MKTVKQLAQQALDIQDACNLSGVVHAMSRACTDLRAQGEYSVDHPILVAYADKIASLTGVQDLGNEKAWKAYGTLAEITEHDC